MEKYHGQKVQRFSIRKYSFGAASVAIAAFMMFGGAATVQAHEQGTSATATSEQPASDVEQPATSVTVTKADTSKLEAAITRMETALEKAGVSEKTAATIENAKAELAKAQSFLSNEKATQAEVDKATRELKNKAFVIESMPKASTDKKENKNQDSRNGQAIPGQGESGFRATPTGVGEQAAEGPTSNNKRGVGANPTDNVISSLKINLGILISLPQMLKQNPQRLKINIQEIALILQTQIPKS